MKCNGIDEMLAIIGLVIIAILAISVLKIGGKEIAIAIAGGLVGYLKGHTPGPETTPPVE